MADNEVWHLPNDAADLPTYDYIVKACTEAGFNRNGVCIQVTGKPPLWVKYGGDYVMRGEGRTQAYVAQIVNADPASVVRVPDVHLGFSRGRRAYIVMDYVHGKTIDNRKSPAGNYYKKDVEAAVAAVKQLINIKMPADTAPGPVGGGLIGHDFFVECLSARKYSTVGQLEAQVNEVLRIQGQGLRVDFQTETANGLILCPSDLNASNFIIDDEEKTWAIDFGRTLPTTLLHVFLVEAVV
ncbi:hypothetical protein EDD15DRAFT_155476 [Pisolithus albus]|nr:hypothetical protein EDD15DRAFT_155476 [Pisolithus albus]